MNTKFFVGTIFLAILLGCANVHTGKYATQVGEQGEKVEQKGKLTKLGLIISGRERTELSSKYFGLLDFTFENCTQDWIRIKRIEISFGNDVVDENISITSGDDIIYWQRAIKHRNIIDDQNTRALFGAIAVLGMGFAIAGGSDELRMLGATSGLGAITSLSVYEYNKNMAAITSSEIFPASHILAEGFNIPPGLFTKKWILLNSRNHKKLGIIKYIFIKYTLDNGKSEKIKLYFRGGVMSRWQRENQKAVHKGGYASGGGSYSN